MGMGGSERGELMATAFAAESGNRRYSNELATHQVSVFNR